MPSLRSKMKDALKTTVVPYLRALGFKGSMPDFYRKQAGHTECLQFYFKRDPGDDRFFLQAGLASNEGIDWHRPMHHRLSPEKVKAGQLEGAIRLGAKAGSNDHWFDFGSRPAEQVAYEVVQFLAAGDYWERLAQLPVTTRGRNYR